MGLNIALSPNLIGSSDVDFHKDSKFGLNSKITFGTKESFVQTTAELNMIELVTVHVGNQLKINKAENQRRDLISQASTVWLDYENTLKMCQGLQIPESGFNPEKMAAVFSEVITRPIC